MRESDSEAVEMNAQSTLIMPTPKTQAPPPVRRYFPGWTMLGIAAAAQFMSAPGQSYSVAAFKDPMREGLGLSETNYSLAFSFATLISAFAMPFYGRFVDRWGARAMLPLIAAGLGLACFYMSRIETLISLYIGFSFVRSLGQGALSLVAVWLVGEWFERRRGMAMAIAGIGGGLSVMTIPLINNWFIMRFGWETAWTVLGLAVCGTLILPGMFLVRNRPEDLGLHPDGIGPMGEPPSDPTGPDRERGAGPSITRFEDSWTVRQILRDVTFWKLLSVPTTAGLVGTGLVFHQVALFGSHGLTKTWALGMMSVQAAFATLMTFPAGWATDRWANRHLLFVAMILLSSASLLAMTMPSQWLSVVYAILLGTQASIFRSTGVVVWINYYGRAHQGAVRGVAWSAMILAAAIGTLPMALSIDYFNSYKPALCFSLVLPLLAAVAVRTALPPRRPSVL